MAATVAGKGMLVPPPGPPPAPQTTDCLLYGDGNLEQRDQFRKKRPNRVVTVIQTEIGPFPFKWHSGSATAFLPRLCFCIQVVYVNCRSVQVWTI